ncbi:MAG: hypothetical protein VX764_08800 [Planctomycetota bacterium]|nr:hypothetical protein [Planctomycetota bacterium]
MKIRDRTYPKIDTSRRSTAFHHWIIFLCVLGTGSLLSAQVGPWIPLDTPDGEGNLANPAPSSNASFGFSLSLSVDRLAVGAFGDDEVYIFEIDPVSGLWQPGQTTSSVAGQLPTLAGWFGWSVSLFGDALAVGAPEDWPGGAPFSGSVHLYQRDLISGMWTLNQSIPNPDLGNYEEFGKSVSLWQDRLAIGAAGDISAPGMISGGSVTIFERDPVTNQWIEAQLIPHPDPQEAAIFGETVSLYGDVLAIGAPWQDGGPNGGVANAGNVYLFERDISDGQWNLITTIANPEPGEWEEFGRVVALDGNLLAIGVPLDESSAGIDGGSVYFYQRDVSTGQWFPADMGPLGGNLPGQVLGPNPSDVEGFGASVSLSDDLMVIGANGIVVGGFDYAGGVYIYQRSAVSGPWQLMQTIYDPDPQTFNMFSNSVEIDADVLVVAKAFDEIGSFVDTGSLYLYGPEGFFIRGDCNGDGAFNIADAIKLLSYLFSGGVLPACLDSCDGNDDGNLNLADAVTMLNELFLPGSPPIPAPDAVCSIDPTDDPLNCGDYDCP